MQRFQTINPNNLNRNINLNYQNTQFYEHDTFMGKDCQNRNRLLKN